MISCAFCENGLLHTAVSFKAFAFDYHELVPEGHCVTCKLPFCKDHLGKYQKYDDDCGTIGDLFFCKSCCAASAARLEKRANWWKQNVPVLGQPISWLILQCCQ